jgi:hypothetical protein
MSFNSHLQTFSVVHSDRSKHAYLNPMPDSRISPRLGFPAGGDGVWVGSLFYTGFQGDLRSFYILFSYFLLFWFRKSVYGVSEGGDNKGGRLGS